MLIENTELEIMERDALLYASETQPFHLIPILLILGTWRTTREYLKVKNYDKPDELLALADSIKPAIVKIGLGKWFTDYWTPSIGQCFKKSKDKESIEYFNQIKNCPLTVFEGINVKTEPIYVKVAKVVTSATPPVAIYRAITAD